MSEPALNDHVTPTDSEYPNGTYRVVGRDDETVPILRVADADGRRRNTGERYRVSREAFDGFDEAENPDGNRPLEETVGSALEMGYWSVRAFVRELLARPGATAVAATMLLIGAVGESVVPGPDVVSSLLVITGALGLAYVGNGRLR